MSHQRNQNHSGEKLIASNPSARSNYFIEEVVEAGLVLTGTEVKSLRGQAPNLKDAFVEIESKRDRFEGWLVNAHIGPYSHGNIWNHEALRRRKVLLHAHQLEKLYGAMVQKGMSIVPLRMYFKKGRAKIELGVGKGKKKYDKRDTLKQKSADREVAQAMKRSRSSHDS
jgi:SsrA-binding protein